MIVERASPAILQNILLHLESSSCVGRCPSDLKSNIKNQELWGGHKEVMVTTRNYFAALVNLAEDEATSSHGEAKEEDANAGAVLQQAIALSLAEAPQRCAVHINAVFICA